MTPAHVAVIDIGKTNVKLALVEMATLTEVHVEKRPNIVREGPPYPHFDTDGIWTFILEGLSGLQRQAPIDAISVTTHGASAALIGTDGTLAAPILDYEHPGPETVAAEYDAIRPGFPFTGSPRLPGGLNLGAQIHWQFAQDPGLRDRTRAIVTYPQYWGHRLSGVLACDLSSLGAHTDLWEPVAGQYSTLTDHLGIRGKMAPARPATKALGPIRPALVAKTGLSPQTQVLCGIHDSNASLLPHLLRRRPPFSVVSTGTWVIAMAIGGAATALDPERDTLMNVNAFGDPVPSARFMGGREYELLGGSDCPPADRAALGRVLEAGTLPMPAVVPGCGPFPAAQHRWIGPEPGPRTPERAAALGVYLALVTAESLTLCGHSGPLIVEGPFARNLAFCTMLAAATGCEVEVADGTTGTSQGAALLALDPGAVPPAAPGGRFVPDNDPLIARCIQNWRTAARGP